jgi:hypothetical protein
MKPVVAARNEAKNAARMRLWRMKMKSSICLDEGAYSGQMCSKFAAPRRSKLFHLVKHIEVRLVPENEPGFVPCDNKKSPVPGYPEGLSRNS